MLNNLDLTKVLVLDIETVSGYKSYEELSPTMQKMWDIKSKQIQARKPEEEQLSPNDSYPEYAGIYAEFGKIVCISVGIFRFDENKILNFYLKSYFSHDEKELLKEFNDLIEKSYNNTNKSFLCGHNIKEFDIPYICRRAIINRMELPAALEISGKKPWELNHLIDTLDQWKFGDYKNYTSLKLLCAVFDIPTPKDDIDGSEVGKTYWNEGDLDRIEAYCKKDVLATARLLMSFKLMIPIEDEMVHIR